MASYQVKLINDWVAIPEYLIFTDKYSKEAKLFVMKMIAHNREIDLDLEPFPEDIKREIVEIIDLILAGEM